MLRVCELNVKNPAFAQQKNITNLCKRVFIEELFMDLSETTYIWIESFNYKG